MVMTRGWLTLVLPTLTVIVYCKHLPRNKTTYLVRDLGGTTLYGLSDNRLPQYVHYLIIIPAHDLMAIAGGLDLSMQTHQYLRQFETSHQEWRLVTNQLWLCY